MSYKLAIRIELTTGEDAPVVLVDRTGLIPGDADLIGDLDLIGADFAAVISDALSEAHSQLVVLAGTQNPEETPHG